MDMLFHILLMSVLFGVNFLEGDLVTCIKYINL